MTTSTITSALPLVFVSGNANKVREVQQILGGVVPHLVSRKLDLPELQGEPEHIAIQKCRIASERVDGGGAVLVEDTSLCFEALGGLPGPYVKWFLHNTGLQGLNNLLAAYPDKAAYALCTFAFCRGPNHEPIVFQGRCDGHIVPARGETTFGWDPVFQPKGFTTTFAEMTKEMKNEISHRSKALAKLRAYFAEHPEALQCQKDTSPE